MAELYRRNYAGETPFRREPVYDYHPVGYTEDDVRRLAACRDKVIEDVAMLFNVMDPDEMLFTGDVATRIRAIKKEPTNG